MKDKRNIRMAIRYTEEEAEDLRKFIKDNTDYTISEFIRRAIKEKRLDLMGYEIEIRKLI
ncbi:hypothetical protein LCGC14_2609300 [marine sediment metagenome]|uniref:Ribbon-helix-helix protein CopG domain-containing protein n=1 Tax=marine sediment metagenome TaxID=412755 RepID=A0A0F9CZ38_9ZZZZ